MPTRAHRRTQFAHKCTYSVKQRVLKDIFLAMTFSGIDILIEIWAIFSSYNIEQNNYLELIFTR